MIYFIIGYILFLIAYMVFCSVAIYHLRRYGYREGASQTMIVVHCVLSIAIIALTFVLLAFSGFSLPNAQLFY